ncbi:ankyrin repeat and sterile alpha motif domain-containing protein 1B-like [Salvelinus fontinalis]|uniref:ankyrin repeat and sterile alpha motif domain-containing protein 1B-like n=1 Tax=Salvelinus fontinalis TaxID=8038 RepID=UPI002485F0F3|nr:ankyrin repeat and sterile alpha motif domain-containing protein 1B-like [Salvelinus fontinalis]
MGKEQELLEAARTGNVVLVEKLLSGKRGILGTASGSIPLPNLLSMWRGLNVNCADSSGYTPLHHASLNGHRDVVLKLLQFEASTNVADSKGCFPLHLAAWRGDVDIVRILVHHGPSHCRVNQQNHERETALHCAAQYGHSEVVSILLQELTDPTMRNSRDETPLDLAALYGRLQVVCMLVTAHPNLMSSHGTRRHTPLHLAARNGHHSAVHTLLEAGMDVNSQTENGSALHEAALYGKMDVVRLLLDSGIDANITDCQGRTALEILREHPAQKSQQITALMQEYMMEEMMDNKCVLMEEPIRQCPVPTPRTSIPSLSASPSLRHKNDAVTGELSKLLNEMKMCRDRDYSFEELCQTISSHSHSMESFGSGHLSDEERRSNGTLSRVRKRPTPPLPPAQEEEEGEKSCGPAGFWEALTPCNGCHNLGFSSLSQDSKRSAEIVPSPSLDVFLPEDEDNPYESVTTAVTRKPCSLDIGLFNTCPLNGHSPQVTVTEPELCNHRNSSSPTGPTPDCSPPSPDTALKSIDRVIRPQPKQRTSLSSSLDVQNQRPVNHSCDPSEVSSSLGYASISTSPPASPPVSPNQDLPGSNDDCPLTGTQGQILDIARLVENEGSCQVHLYSFLMITRPQPQPPSSNSPIHPTILPFSFPSPPHSSSTMASSFDSHIARNMMWQCQLSQPDCRCYRVDGYSLLKRLPLHPLIGPRCPMQSVGQWLDSIGLVQYENHLLANGFDNVQFMGSNVVEDQDLLEIGILNSAHRQRLLQAIRLLPRVRPIGYDGNNPTSVAEWLESLELGDYTKSFLINGYTSMELVKKIWEIELINVLKVSLIGHRKRILASLGDRLHQDPPQKPPRAISLREPGGCNTPPQILPGQAAYTTAGVPGGSLDVQHLIMQADARRRQRSNDNYLEEMPRSKLERQMAQVSMSHDVGERPSARNDTQGEWCEPITLRPPNEATSSTPVQYWQHHPEKLIFQSCDYEAYYLGSMLVKELRGTESTQDACSKMRKSTEQMKKVPTIVLSVSYKGVKFIDATNKNIIAEHEIRNISCAAQDPEDLSTFAYITKDLKSSHHYCHVFTAFDVNLAYEIILTLGQAFEVAYQLALQARKSGHGSSTLPESFDIKPNKPVPKPRVNIRKSMEQPSMEQKGHANVPWIVEPGQEAKRGANTKAKPILQH